MCRRLPVFHSAHSCIFQFASSISAPLARAPSGELTRLGRDTQRNLEESGEVPIKRTQQTPWAAIRQLWCKFWWNDKSRVSMASLPSLPTHVHHPSIFSSLRKSRAKEYISVSAVDYFAIAKEETKACCCHRLLASALKENMWLRQLFWLTVHWWFALPGCE